MLGDIQILAEATFGYSGDQPQQVESGAVATINAGEPVSFDPGQQYVLPAANGMPIVGTDHLAGIAATTSTDTADLDGKVQVTKITQGVIYLGNPLDPTLWDTQAEYDALVGSRVLFNLTNGVYTITSTDNAANGLFVENLDVKRYPGKVAFSIRTAVSYNV